MKRVHDRGRVGQLFGGGGLEAGEPVHRDHVNGVPPRLVGCASQVLNTWLERPSTMSSSRAGLVPSRMRVRSMTTVTNRSPRRVCRQQCSSTPMTATPSRRPGSSISTRPPSASTASFAVFHATPRPSATGHGQVLAHDAGRCPPLPAPGPLRPGLGHPGGCPAATHAHSRCTGSGAP